MKETKYKILEHRADFKIRVFGKTKEELFLNALLAVRDFLEPETTEGKEKKREIKISAPDLSLLLVDFLNEVLYLIQTKKEIYQRIEFLDFKDTKLKAKLFGKKVKYFLREIKAATYHNLEVSQNKNGLWQAVILFDI